MTGRGAGMSSPPTSGEPEFMEAMDSRFRGNDGQGCENDGKGCGNDVSSRHPRESEGPGLITKMDSRFRGNDRREAGMTPFFFRHPRENGDSYSKLLDF